MTRASLLSRIVRRAVVVGSLENERALQCAQPDQAWCRPLRSAEGKGREETDRGRGAHTGRSCQIGVARRDRQARVI